MVCHTRLPYQASSVLTVTTCHGMNFPLAWRARVSRHFNTATAGNLHADDGDIPYIVGRMISVSFFRVIHHCPNLGKGRWSCNAAGS